MSVQPPVTLYQLLQFVSDFNKIVHRSYYKQLSSRAELRANNYAVPQVVKEFLPMLSAFFDSLVKLKYRRCPHHVAEEPCLSFVHSAQ